MVYSVAIYSYVPSSLPLAADPRWVCGGQVIGIAGCSEQFYVGVSGLVKQPLDCTVGGRIIL